MGRNKTVTESFRSTIIATGVLVLLAGTNGNVSAQPEATSGPTTKRRGMIEIPELSPTTTEGKTRKPTGLEKRAARKAQIEQDAPVYFDPKVRNMPPQSPDGSTSSSSVVPPVGGPLNSSTYSEQGPGPSNSGQSENAAPSNQVVGACNALACHPSDANVLYAAFTNGGIWKTLNATNSAPTWSSQTDSLGSLSIGALEFDPTDGTRNTLMAGIGNTSSLASVGGALVGVLRTVNGGTTWTVTGAALLAGKNISGIAPRGSTVVVSVDLADSFTFSNIGIFRSTSSGASFTKISGSGPSTFANGLPGGRAFDLQGDPSNNAVLYTAIRDAGSNNGIYKSVDTGANWTRVSDATMNGMITDSPSTSKMEIATGTSGNVYVAIVRSGSLFAVFRSGNSGGTWTQMGTPGTTEVGATFHGIHVGGQGGLHLSLAADPSNANVVYIGGDRQPGNGDVGGVSFPNSIGAQNYSGRLFRGDASQPLASQWKPLTHSNSVVAFPGGGTASSSSPHADSRDMAVDVNGRLIEGDDGGVFARTNPQNNTGDWFSLQGSLKSTEVHDVGYDAISNKIIVGTQDNGSASQTSSGNWDTIQGGDGGDVCVDDVTLAGSNQSIRYMSFQYLGGFNRRTYNSVGTETAFASCPLTVQGGGPAIVTQFVTPVKLNKVAPTRLVIGGQNNVYESLDQGNTCSVAFSGVWAGPDGMSGCGLAYGGKQSGVDNPNVLYVVDGNIAYVRTAALPAAPTSNVVPTGGETLCDVVLDPSDYTKAYAVSATKVYQSINTGATWTEITGVNPTGLVNIGKFRCIEFVPTPNGGAIVVGGQLGVFTALASTPTQWFRLGTNLPAAAYVFDLEYDSADNALVAGTLGRSVWMLPNASVATGNVTAADATWLTF